MAKPSLNIYPTLLRGNLSLRLLHRRLLRRRSLKNIRTEQLLPYLKPQHKSKSHRNHILNQERDRNKQSRFCKPHLHQHHKLKYPQQMTNRQPNNTKPPANNLILYLTPQSAQKRQKQEPPNKSSRFTKQNPQSACEPRKNRNSHSPQQNIHSRSRHPQLRSQNHTRQSNSKSLQSNRHPRRHRQSNLSKHRYHRSKHSRNHNRPRRNSLLHNNLSLSRDFLPNLNLKL